MKISRQLAVLAAALCGLHLHVQSRALPETSLSPREHRSILKDITLLETRNLLFGRAPVFVEPKASPKLGAHDGNAGGSSSSSSSSSSDPGTGGGVHLGADNSGGASTGDSSGSGGGVHLGADNSGGASTGDSSGSGGGVHLGADNSGGSTSGGQSGGQSGSTQPNVRPSTGDASSGGNTGDQQAAQGPKVAGASKPGDNGIATVGEPKDLGKLKTKGQQVDGETQKAIKENKDDKVTPDIDEHYNIEKKAMGATLNPADAKNKDIVTPFEDLRVDLSRARYNEYALWSSGVYNNKPVSIGKYFARDGVIVGQTRFAEHDLNPAADKMASSDQVFHLWRTANSVEGDAAATLEATKNLRGFVGRDIQSLSTIQTMQAMQKKVGAALDRKTTFKRAPDPNDKPEVTTAKKEAFDTMLGTDFISSLNYMLKDHSKALGRKQITEITAYPRTFDPSTKSGMERITIGVVFEEVK